MPENFYHFTSLEYMAFLEHLYRFSLGVRKGCTRVDLVLPRFLGLQRPFGSQLYTLLQRHSLVDTT